MISSTPEERVTREGIELWFEMHGYPRYSHSAIRDLAIKGLSAVSEKAVPHCHATDTQCDQGCDSALKCSRLSENVPPSNGNTPTTSDGSAEAPGKPGTETRHWLAERIAWLKREWEAGGDYEYLNTRRKEAIYIAEKLGVDWMPK